MQNLESEIQFIKERNARVEADKAWETSWTRKIGIAVTTYIIISAVFIVMGVERPFLNAVIPTLGFLLSTLSLSVLKRLWVKYFYKK